MSSGRRRTSYDGMDPPLRKRLADLEMRRNTLIDAMSKFQDAKKSALFQYLSENQTQPTASSSMEDSIINDDFITEYRTATAVRSTEGSEHRENHVDSIRDRNSSSRDTASTISIDIPTRKRNDRIRSPSPPPPAIDRNLRSLISPPTSWRGRRSMVQPMRDQNDRIRSPSPPPPAIDRKFRNMVSPPVTLNRRSSMVRPDQNDRIRTTSPPPPALDQKFRMVSSTSIRREQRLSMDNNLQSMEDSSSSWHRSREQRSLVLSEKRQNYRRRLYDAGSSHSRATPPSRAYSEASGRRLRRSRFLGDGDAPSDEGPGGSDAPSDEVITSYGDDFSEINTTVAISDERMYSAVPITTSTTTTREAGSNAPSDEVETFHADNSGEINTKVAISDGKTYSAVPITTTTREAVNLDNQVKNSSEIKYSRGDHLRREESESDKLAELKNSTISRKQTNQQGNHPILIRLRELKESNSAEIPKPESAKDDENESRAKLFSRLDEIVEERDAQSARNKLCEYENKIAKKPEVKNIEIEKFRKLFVASFDEEDETPKNKNTVDHVFNYDQRSHGETKNDLRLGRKASASISTDNGREKASATAAAKSNKGGDNHMAVLETKLNMMISKKPLWQKALQNLYEEPFDARLSVSASSSGVSKPPSEAESLWSSDAASKENGSKRSCSVDASADTILKSEGSLAKNNTNDLNSRGESDTLESWRMQSACSIDSPNVAAPSGVASHHEVNTMNTVDSTSDLVVENDRKTELIGEDGSSAAETDTIHSQSIQEAKDYLDNLPESLSDLRVNSAIEEGTKEEMEMEMEMEMDVVGSDRIDANIRSPHTADSGSGAPEEDGQMDSTHERQQYVHTSTPLQSNQSSLIEEDNPTEWEIEDICVEYVEREVNSGSLQTRNTIGSIAGLDTEWIDSLRAGFINSLHLEPKSSEQPEAVIESPQGVQSKDTEPLGEEHMEKQQRILTVFSQATNQQIEVKIESPQKVESKDPSTLNEENTDSKHTVLQHLQSLNFESDSLPTAEVYESVLPTDEEQMVSNYPDDHQNEQMACEANEQIIGAEIDSLSIPEDDNSSTPFYEDQVPLQTNEPYEQINGEIEDQFVSFNTESYEEIVVGTEDQMMPQNTESYEQIDVEAEDQYFSFNAQSYEQIDVEAEDQYCSFNSQSYEEIDVAFGGQAVPQNSESYEQIDVEIEDQFMSCNSESYEEIDVGIKDQVVSQYTESYEQIDVDTDHLQMTEIEEEIMVPQTEQQWKMEMISPAVDIRTPPASNAGKQFLSKEIDKNNTTNSQNFHDAVSDLSDEDSTMSLEVSSSSNSMGVDDILDSGDQKSEESSIKPPIPNEVTMLTDFTVQSITYRTSNTSNIESLGEESVVQEYQTNRKASKFNMMSSNSESTIIHEKRRKAKKETALQAEKPQLLCAESLMKIVKNPLALCQCTGPVAINDIALPNQHCAGRDNRRGYC